MLKKRAYMNTALKKKKKKKRGDTILAQFWLGQKRVANFFLKSLRLQIKL